MHTSVLRWAAAMVDKYALAQMNVLEVGSYNVNGSVRDMFRGRYTGIDMRPGPGVDKTWDIEQGYYLASHPVDLVVSTEMLEHTPRPHLAFRYMVDCLGSTNGLLMLTTRGFLCPKHDHPSDFYRFSPEALAVMVSDNSGNIWELDEDSELPGSLLLAQFPIPVS